MQAAQIERTPLRRMAEASDQAKVICFLASSDADFVTGLTIDVTGGSVIPRMRNPGMRHSARTGSLSRILERLCGSRSASAW